MNVLDPFDNKLSKSEKKLIDEHNQLALDWAECRDEYYNLFSKSNNISNKEFQLTFSTKYLSKNQECVSKLKSYQQFLKENEQELDPILIKINSSVADSLNTLDVNFKDFDSKNLPLLIQNKKLAGDFITCKQDVSDNIIEYSEDIIDSIENGNVGQLLMDISICKGKITAFEKFLEINEKELLVVFEDTEWDYYQLVGALEATDGQLDTTYNEFSEAQSLYYNS